MCRSLGRYGAVTTIVLLIAAGWAQGVYQPWDALIEDSWVFGHSTPSPRMYAVNSSVAYRVAFSPKKRNGGARGVNGLRFFAEGADHHVTGDMAGSFTVKTMGTEDYSAILMLVAIDTDTLPDEFALTLAGHAVDPHQEFVYYDPVSYDTGRPAGYYSETNPTAEPLSYLFDDGMVSLLAIEGLSFTADSPVTVPYAFEYLPGPAVFSVYGVGLDGQGDPYDIYHTNRGTEDLNDPGRGVSTFTVLPEPGSAVLLAWAAVMLLAKRRR